MRYRLTFLLGVGAGYVLGARAGRERYDALMRSFRDAKEQPGVQSAAGVVAAQASGLAQKAKSAVSAAVGGSETDSAYPATPLNSSPNGLGGSA
ncbi:MAG TPA: hypothetical protein VLR26_12045 [Frankiaceae bacterium]|nr:hypothetical protein [Frankiaceae bacterium]